MLTIPEYYADKNIFVTGATGFIGKVLIEKLLRSCPRIKGIYCLIRPKKGKAAQERLTKLFEGKLFVNLREQQPDFESKVHAIHGDILEDGLGILQRDKSLLDDNINVVFHSAATIRFDEPLRLAMEMNVLGLRRMIKLCRGFKKLEVFLHVSSAYANCDRENIDEVVYPPPVDPQKVFDCLEWMDDEMLIEITPKLMGAQPNTYTYTKQLAEALLVKEGADLPVAIVRPSIVAAAWKEPVPGWVDSWNGPSGLYIAAGKGLLRSMKCRSNTVADMIPVDFPVNMMISAAWYTATAKPKNIQIYHLTSGGLNPFTWGQMGGVVINYFKRNPLEDCYRRPKIGLTRHSFLHEYWLLVSHLIPAYALDLGYLLIGKKPRVVQIYNKLHKALGTMEYFTLHEWEWSHANTDTLKSQMSDEDKQIYYFDPRALHWPTYIENYCLGTKTYILKEDASGLPAARAHLRKLRNIRYTFNTVLLVVLWRLLIARSHLARNIWYFVMGLVFKFVRFFHITSTIG